MLTAEWISILEPSATGIELRIALSVIAISLLGIFLTLVGYYRHSLLRVCDTRVRRVLLLFSNIACIGVVLGFFILIWDVSEPVLHLYAQRVQTNVVVRVFVTVTIIVITYLGTDALDTLTRRIVQEDGRQVVDEHRREVIFRVNQLILYIFVGFALLNYWDVDIGSILVGAGALAAIIGLSARHTMSAALAGIILLFSRPFKVGDWIEVDGDEGTVHRITIMNTILQTPDSEEVVIPNDVISQQTVINKNNTGKLRLAFDVGVEYGINLDNATELAEEAIKDCNIVADVPGPKARVKTFDDSSVIIRVYYWIRSPTPARRTTSKSNTQTAIKQVFDKNDIDIPFPQQDITYYTPKTDTKDEQLSPDSFESSEDDIEESHPEGDEDEIMA